MRPPSSSVTVDIHVDKSLYEETIRTVCKELLTGWAAAGDIHLHQITGGITNVLYKAWVSPDSGVPDPAAIVRVFGDKSELFIDRDRDLQVLLQMNAQNFGPRLLGTFANGRLEKFINARPLNPDEFADPALSRRIAVALRELHTVKIDEDSSPRVWRSIHDWLDQASKLTFEHDPKKAERFGTVDFAQLRREAEEAEAACSALGSPVVFCHNDLLAPNILVEETASGPHGPLHIIDFEYGAYNCRDFDFGNHFNEWAGFDADYSKYPSEAQRRAFIAAYLGRAEEASARTPQEELELDALVVSATAFSLASHLYWGIWALIQARFSPIDFDFLEYHFLRLDEFRRRKEAWLGAAKGLSKDAKQAAGWAV